MAFTTMFFCSRTASVCCLVLAVGSLCGCGSLRNKAASSVPQAAPQNAPGNSNTTAAPVATDLEKARLDSLQAYKPFLKFVGNGNIQKTFEQGEKIPAATGVGLVFKQNYHRLETTFLNTQRLEAELIVNIASTADSIVGQYGPEDKLVNSREFGSFVLFPKNASQSGSMNVRLYTRRPQTNSWYNVIKHIEGIDLGLFGSNKTFFVNDTTGISTSIIGAKAGIFFEFVKPAYIDNYSISLGFQYLYRNISGDFRNVEYNAHRNVLLNTTRTSFHGLNTQISFRVKDLRATLDFPVMPVVNGRAVPGLSNIQFATTISFVGGFPILLSKRDRDQDIDTN